MILSNRWSWQVFAKASCTVLMIVFCALQGCSSTGVVMEPRLVTYLRAEDTPRLDPNALAYVDDLIYTRVTVLADGGLQPPKSAEADLATLNSHRKAYPEVQLLISIAGKQSNLKGFPFMAADPLARNRFAQNLVAFCLKHQLQGVDIDWEYPRGEQQQQHATQLFRLLKRVFSENDLKLTAAFNYAQSQVNFLATIADNIDQIHLMTYEPAPKGTNLRTFQDLIDHGIGNVINAGITKDKVIIGVPFFGRLEGSRKTLLYRNIVEHYQPAPDQDLASGYQFIGKESMKRNALFAKNNGWGGIMVWSLGYDQPLNSPMALLPAIDAGLSRQ